MKKAVVTGPTGAVGMALIEELVKNGITVYAVVRPGSKRAERIIEHEGLIKIECDLSGIRRLPELIPGGADMFYHFGWDGTFGDSRNDMFLQNRNAEYALNAVEAAHELGCTVFIGAGSQAEYGRYEGKLTPDVPVFPENGYGIAKLCAGQMTRILCEQKGMRHIWTRILSVYGPFDGNQTMIMSTIYKLLQGKKPSCTKGEQIWDYLYSKDAARAFFLLGVKGVHGKTYCIGSSDARPLREYILAIRDAIDSDAEIGFGDIDYSPRQVMFLCADIEELSNDTGFRPAYSFDQGIRETIEYCRQTLNMR